MNDFFHQRRRLRTLVAVLTAAGIGVTIASCSSHSAARTAAGLPAASGSSTTAGTSAVAVPGGASTSTAPAAQSATTATTGPKASAPSTAPAAGPLAPSVPLGPVAPPTGSAPPVPPPVPASSLPNAAKVSWQPMGGLVAMTVPTVRDIGIDECAKVHGALAWHEQGYVSAQHTPALEDIFGFGDAQTAAQAFSAISAGLDACQQTTRDVQRTAGAPQDAVVATTATAARAQAWSRRWTGVPGQSAGGMQTNHYYAVQRGSTVLIASFTEFGANPPNPYDPAGDPAVLTMLAATVAS